MNKTWKIIIRVIVVIIAIIILVVGGFWLWLTHEGSTKDIEAVANQFQPGSSWVETARRVEPPRNACIGDNPCPSVFKSWKAPYVVSKAEFQSLLQKAGWNFPIKGECDVMKGGMGSGTTICGTSGRLNDYNIAVDIIGASDQPELTKITLDVR